VSGNAPGSDQAFALGGNLIDSGKVELCLPWKTFEERWIMPTPTEREYPNWRQRGFAAGNTLRLSSAAMYQHLQLAQWHCLGTWSRLRQPVQKLMLRNAMMLIAADGVSSTTVLACPAFHKSGWSGTGHTIRIAGYLGIPVWLVELGRYWRPEEGTN